MLFSNRKRWIAKHLPELKVCLYHINVPPGAILQSSHFQELFERIIFSSSSYNALCSTLSCEWLMIKVLEWISSSKDWIHLTVVRGPGLECVERCPKKWMDFTLLILDVNFSGCGPLAINTKAQSFRGSFWWQLFANIQ